MKEGKILYKEQLSKTCCEKRRGVLKQHQFATSWDHKPTEPYLRQMKSKEKVDNKTTDLTLTGNKMSFWQNLLYKLD